MNIEHKGGSVKPEAGSEKERVLQMWPDAYACYLPTFKATDLTGPAGWILRRGYKEQFAPLTADRRETEAEAWADAASRISNAVPPEKCANCGHRNHYALRCGALTGEIGLDDAEVRCECLVWNEANAVPEPQQGCRECNIYHLSKDCPIPDPLPAVPEPQKGITHPNLPSGWLERALHAPKKCPACGQQTSPLPSQGEQDKWISVDQELPQGMSPVMTTNGQRVTQAYRTGEYPDGQQMWSAWSKGEVTHWMRLPAPPAPAKESSQCLNK